jgi:outer membrane protein assembly factor BamD
VVEQYQTTSHVPEALHRLVEAYLSLGVIKEAKTAAAVLGHNYPGSDWYEDTYALMQEYGGVDNNGKRYTPTTADAPAAKPAEAAEIVPTSAPAVAAPEGAATADAEKDSAEKKEEEGGLFDWF